jgi:hypothetical protein
MAKIAYRSGGGGFFDTQRQRSLRVHTPQQQQGLPVHFLKPRKEKEEALSFSFTIFEEAQRKQSWLCTKGCMETQAQYPCQSFTRILYNPIGSVIC